MKIKDHFLSQEVFEVKASKYDGILETNPKPEANKLADYYDSPDYISHQTKSSSVLGKIYHKVKSIMLSRKKRLILGFKREGCILDIGAGTGEFLECFEERNWKKSAIEPSAKLKSTYKEKNINLIQELDEVKNHSFDVITLWHSLEHIPDLQKTIVQLKRILKPEGILIIAVPNFNSYDSKFYKNYWAAWDVPRHLWHFSRQGLKMLFQKNNFECLREVGMPFDAYYVSMLSENYKPNGFKLRAFLVGALSNLKSSSNKEYSSIMYVLRASEVD